jgi:4-amino-4-deoxy-L-arabinose transferase-like glycosyltransferase
MKFGLLGAPRGVEAVADSSGMKTGKKRYTACLGLKLGLQWEIYPILLIAAVLRFYMINKTEFDADQATIFSMAYDAVSHGWLVATSNVASIGIVNPPAIVYFLMVPAALSSNPVWGTVLTAIFATLAVLLTYIFVHCYYGRLAAAIAALLYATAALPVFYSRFIWQQNLLLFFVPLYIFLLFHGAVARRQGWLGPALFLLGLLLQLHGSAFLLVVPLFIAVAVAPYTVRWRDVLLGLLLLLVIYATYILWETWVHFHDISVLFNATRQSSSIDLQALTLYQSLLSPYNILSMSPRSLLAPFVPLFNGIWWVMTVLVMGSAVLALGLVLALRSTSDQVGGSGNVAFGQIKLWWRVLCASPYCCGLSVLLAWQIVPLLALLRHSITLHPHYFIMFMPGPFILVGIFVTEATGWLRKRGRWGILGRRILLGMISVIMVAQMIGAAVSVVDLTNGNFIDSSHMLSSTYYNDLNSLQHALSETDQIAQGRHLKHAYIDADSATIDAFRYLSTQMHTPTTVFSDSCALLPNLANGPVVLLVSAHSRFIETLLPRFVTASLVATPARLGGPPFRVYILSSVRQPVTVEDTLAPNLQLVDAQSFTFQHRPFLLTRWRFLLSQPSADDTLYSYNIAPVPDAATVTSLNQNRGDHTKYRAPRRLATVKCALTSIQAGDQLFVSFQLPSERLASLNLSVQTSTIKGEDLAIGFPSLGLAFETFRPVHTTQQTLLSSTGRNFVSISSLPVGQIERIQE